MKRSDDKDMSRFDDMLSRYIKGEMSPKEETAFRKLLDEDECCRDKAIATARLVRGMRQSGSKKDKGIIDSIKALSETEAKGIAAKACGAGYTKTRTSSFRRIMVSIAVAASVLLCIFGGYRYYEYDRVTSLGTEYLTYFPSSEFSRGENDGVEGKLKGLYSDIESKKNLGKTIAELSVMWNESRSDSYNDYTDHMPEIGWMLANAYLLANDRDHALAVLDTLTSEYPEGTALGDKSRELKQKIEK